MTTSAGAADVSVVRSVTGVDFASGLRIRVKRTKLRRGCVHHGRSLLGSASYDRVAALPQEMHTAGAHLARQTRGIEIRLSALAE